MKRFAWVSLLLCLVFVSCKEYNEVRIMPEFNNSETEITLYKNVGSSATVVINTTAADIIAEYSADWLAVDVNRRRVIYTVTKANETGEPRTAAVKLVSGEWTEEIIVTQRELDESEIRLLKVGDLTEDGLGMVFWVDPENPEVGKAVSLQRQGGKAFEASVKLHEAFSTVNGVENTAKYADAGADDAVTFCTSLGEGWYLPAQNELLELFKAYNGAGPSDAGFTNATPDAISDSEKTARAIFDKKLTDLGGAVINAAASGNGESYWASTENDAGDKARYVRFGKYGLDWGAKTGTTRFARAMKLVGKYKFPEEPATLNVTPTEVSLASEEGSAKEVTVTTNKDSYTYTVAGEDVAWLKHEQNGDKVTFTTLTANTGDKERSVTVTFTAGSEENQVAVEVVVTQEKMPAASAFTIGEYVDKDGGAQLAEGGIVFWTEGNEAKILSLKRYGPMNWVEPKPAGLTGVTDEYDGEANTQKMREVSTGNFPVLEYCTDGWYFPARQEMEEVFRVYNGGPASAPVKPEAITEAEKQARAAWDLILTTHGGDVMNAKTPSETGDSYLTSTEHPTNAANMYYVRFGQWGAGLAAAKYTQNPVRYVRLIRKVSK